MSGSLREKETKILVDNSVESVEKYGNCLCTAYIECPNKENISFKTVQIGNRCEVKVLCHNSVNWQSNAEPCTQGIYSIKEKVQELEVAPIYAINYVTDGVNKFAVSIDLAPRLNDFGLEVILGKKEIAKAIAEYIL